MMPQGIEMADKWLLTDCNSFQVFYEEVNNHTPIFIISALNEFYVLLCTGP